MGQSGEMTGYSGAERINGQVIVGQMINGWF